MSRSSPRSRPTTRPSEELDGVQAEITDNEHQIAATKSNIKRGQRDLAAKLVVAYRAGDPDAVAAMLSADSLEDMLGSVDVLKRSSSQLSSVIVELRESRSELKKREKALEKAERRAAELKAQKAAEQGRDRERPGAGREPEVGPRVGDRLAAEGAEARTRRSWPARPSSACAPSAPRSPRPTQRIPASAARAAAVLLRWRRWQQLRRRRRGRHPGTAGERLDRRPRRRGRDVVPRRAATSGAAPAVAASTAPA